MRTGFISPGGRIDTFHNHQSKAVDELQRRFCVVEKTQDQSFAENVIDKDVTGIVIAHAQVDM